MNKPIVSFFALFGLGVLLVLWSFFDATGHATEAEMTTPKVKTLSIRLITPQHYLECDKERSDLKFKLAAEKAAKETDEEFKVDRRLLRGLGPTDALKVKGPVKESISRRDFFAAAALIGLITKGKCASGVYSEYEKCAIEAARYADQMEIKARK